MSCSYKKKRDTQSFVLNVDEVFPLFQKFNTWLAVCCFLAVFPPVFVVLVEFPPQLPVNFCGKCNLTSFFSVCLFFFFFVYCEKCLLCYLLLLLLFYLLLLPFTSAALLLWCFFLRCFSSTFRIHTSAPHTHIHTESNLVLFLFSCIFFLHPKTETSSLSCTFVCVRVYLVRKESDFFQWGSYEFPLKPSVIPL